LGEVILAATSFPLQLGTEEQIMGLVRSLCSSPQVFYTDQAAVSALESAFGVEGLDLQNPARLVAPLDLLDALLLGEHQGDPHLKVLLAHSDLFGVDARQVTRAVRAFFRALWQGADVEVKVLQSRHSEKAFLELRLSSCLSQKSTSFSVFAYDVKGADTFRKLVTQ